MEKDSDSSLHDTETVLMVYRTNLVSQRNLSSAQLSVARALMSQCRVLIKLTEERSAKAEKLICEIDDFLQKVLSDDNKLIESDEIEW